VLWFLGRLTTRVTYCQSNMPLFLLGHMSLDSVMHTTVNGVVITGSYETLVMGTPYGLILTRASYLLESPLLKGLCMIASVHLVVIRMGSINFLSRIWYHTHRMEVGSSMSLGTLRSWYCSLCTYPAYVYSAPIGTYVGVLNPTMD